MEGLFGLVRGICLYGLTILWNTMRTLYLYEGGGGGGGGGEGGDMTVISHI